VTIRTAVRALISRAETAAMLGISLVTLDRLTRAHRGPKCVRIGRRVLFHATAVEAWIARQSRRPTRSRAGR